MFGELAVSVIKQGPVAVIILGLCACGGGGDGGDGGGADSMGQDVPPESGPADVQDTGTVDGTPCDDGDPCTSDDQFLDGVCVGEAYECPSGTPFCVSRSCDGEGGCVVSSVQSDYCFADGGCFGDGVANPKDDCAVCDAMAQPQGWSAAAGVTVCSDGDTCTTDDHCDWGQCVGTPLDCDDGNPCTSGECQPGLGCVQTEVDGFCDDGDLCSLDDICVAGTCMPGRPRPNCDDGNPCTVDSCVPATGCQNVLDPATACNDGNECTTDTCDAVTGCDHDPVGGPCEDGDLCTTGDVCLNGQCQTGNGVPDCEDDSPCTDDSCNPLFGCIHAKLSGDCDDGNECTVDDVCVGGQCTGNKTSACPDCPYEANPHANKVTVFQVGTSGHPGQGMNLDYDVETCAPSTDCSGGIDNELGLLAPFINSGVTEAVENGYLTYLFEFQDFVDDGTPFTLIIHSAYIHKSNPDCDFQNVECAFYAVSETFDVDCTPKGLFDNAVVVDGHLSAGGKGYGFNVKTTLMSGGDLELGITNMRIEADVQMSQAGTQVAGMQGFLGGAVDKGELIMAIDSLPDDVFPLDKETIKGMLDTLIVNDLDSDGDGVDDAASAAIRITTIPAALVPPGDL